MAIPSVVLLCPAASTVGTNRLSPTSPLTTPNPTSLHQIVEDLQTLAAWAHGALGESELKSVLSSPELPWPPAVQQALDRILAAPTNSVGASKLSQYDFRILLLRLLTGLTDLQLLVLRHRLFTLAPLTQAALAGLVGVSSQRISQVQASAIKTLSSLLGSEEAAPVRWRAELLRTQLGDAIPIDSPMAEWHFDDIEGVCGTTVGTTGIPTREFFLYVAGPYDLTDHWLIRRGSSEALDAIEHSLRETSGEDGVASFDEVRTVQEPLIHPDHHTRWMVERTAFVLRSGVGYLDNSGNMVDKACRALRRLGRPASLDQLQQEMGTNYSASAARGRLYACNEIKRSGKDRWALSEWPHDEYTGISDEIAQEIEACGGVATLDHLFAVIPGRYGVAESSVRSLVHAPRFVVGTNGTVRMRDATESINTRPQSLRDTPRCYQVRGRWVTRMEVDHDLLRGSGCACPVALAQFHGMAPGDRHVFTCHDAEVLLTWNDRAPSGPTFGSLRSLAARLACEEGDWLFFGPSARTSVAWRLPRLASDTAEGTARAVLLTGGNADDHEHARKWLADVLDLNKTADYGRISEAFRARQEDDLANLLPHSVRSRNRDDAYRRMLEALRTHGPS